MSYTQRTLVCITFDHIRLVLCQLKISYVQISFFFIGHELNSALLYNAWQQWTFSCSASNQTMFVWPWTFPAQTIMSILRLLVYSLYLYILIEEKKNGRQQFKLYNIAIHKIVTSCKIYNVDIPGNTSKSCHVPFASFFSFWAMNIIYSFYISLTNIMAGSPM